MIISKIFILITALLHVYFLILEMFLWTKPLGLKVFRQTIEQASLTQTLAANQGLYNGFLAIGLIYGLLCSNPEVSKHFIIFFLTCVIVAGIYGAMTVGVKLFFIQSMPAILALIFFLLKF
jgi:putative membrane protein